MAKNLLTEKTDQWAVDHQWNAKRIARWERTLRQRILSVSAAALAGFLVLGIATAVALWLFDRDMRTPWFIQVVPAIIVLIVGSGFTLLTWRINERQYKLAIQRPAVPQHNSQN